MAGHILQPAYSRHFSPELTEEQILPASCSKELVQGLLRGKLGFQGVVLTDAANMLGYCTAMKRRDLIPATINSGVDMILFGKNLAEDLSYLIDAVRTGVVSMERLDEAVTACFGIKSFSGASRKETFYCGQLPRADRRTRIFEAGSRVCGSGNYISKGYTESAPGYAQKAQTGMAPCKRGQAWIYRRQPLPGNGHSRFAEGGI